MCNSTILCVNFQFKSIMLATKCSEEEAYLVDLWGRVLMWRAR